MHTAFTFALALMCLLTKKPDASTSHSLHIQILTTCFGKKSFPIPRTPSSRVPLWEDKASDLPLQRTFNLIFASARSPIHPAGSHPTSIIVEVYYRTLELNSPKMVLSCSFISSIWLNKSTPKRNPGPCIFLGNKGIPFTFSLKMPRLEGRKKIPFDWQRIISNCPQWERGEDTYGCPL